jgi:hypothetical protein
MAGGVAWTLIQRRDAAIVAGTAAPAGGATGSGAGGDAGGGTATGVVVPEDCPPGQVVGIVTLYCGQVWFQYTRLYVTPPGGGVGTSGRQMEAPYCAVGWQRTRQLGPSKKQYAPITSPAPVLAQPFLQWPTHFSTVASVLLFPRRWKTKSNAGRA